VQFEQLAEVLLRDHNIYCLRADCQSIASKFVESATPAQVAEVLGVPVVSSGSPIDPATLVRQEAIASFTFFSPESLDFRKTVLDRTVISAIRVLKEDASRDHIIEKTKNSLGLSDEQGGLASGAVDRLLQRGEIAPGKFFTLAPHIASAHQLAENTFAASRETLEDAITTILAELGTVVSRNGELVPAVMNGLGALLISTAHSASKGLSDSQYVSEFQRTVREKIRSLHSMLDSFGIPTGNVRNTLLEKIIYVAEGSVFGRALMSGELFIHLVSQTPSQFFLALNGQSKAKVVLDASVAIPYYCCALFENTNRKFFGSSFAAVSQSTRLGCTLLLPTGYFSEVAGHLRLAYDRYRDLIGTDPDLAYSENAFVAYYSQISSRPDCPNFNEYLRLLGFDLVGYKAGKFGVNEPALRRTFEKLGVEVARLTGINRESRIAAQREMTFLIKENSLERHTLTVDHDIEMLAFLRQGDWPADLQLILCTWDSIHLKAYESAGSPGWTTVSPSVLTDLMTLVSRRTDDLTTPSVIAAYIHEETSRNGGKLLDTLARIEKGGLHTAVLIDKARRFKDRYLRKVDYQLDTKTISLAWERWKKEQ
jgi:hypothetical protein